MNDRVTIERGETYRDEAGQHRFRVVAGNERIIAWGEGYGDKADATAAVRALVDPTMHVLVCSRCGRYFGVAWNEEEAFAVERTSPCLCGASELTSRPVNRGTPVVEGSADR